MRTLLAIGVGLVGMVLLAAAFLLVPAHWQTRRISPPLPDVAALRALGAVADGPIGLEYLAVASQASPRGQLGHSVFLVRWADGRTFMIDAGMDRAAAAEFAELLKLMWGAEDGRFHGDVAEQLGDEIARVEGVGFTHLHIDHSQGVVPFCAARGPGASVYQTRWQAEEHNFNTTEGAELVAESCLSPRALAGGPLMTVEGFPGLGVVALGGHTPGSTLFAVPLAGHLWLFSGDTTNTKASLRDDVEKPFFYSYLVVPENTARTAELRHWLAALDAEDDITVIVSHDLPDIAASGIPEHRAQPVR
jgi:glyoxylase-like metal-dependent hydrolase (beta-lactamase superfamily II)